jgi:hypothetical protein
MNGIKIRIEHSPLALRVLKAAVMAAGFACASALWIAIADKGIPGASFGEFLALAVLGEAFIGYIFWRAIKGED